MAHRRIETQDAMMTNKHWYGLSNDGVAIPFASKDDAKQYAKLADVNLPKGAPWRVVRLVDYAEVEHLRAELA